MEYETYETYETAYETDAAYDDIYAGDSKAKAKSPTGKENLKEGDAKETNLLLQIQKKATVVMLGLIAILLLVVVVQQSVALAFAAKSEAEEAENDEQCSKPYEILSDSWRKIDFTSSSTGNCDSGLVPNWYRFSFNGNDSYARIPSSPPARKHQGTKKPCGTARVSWMYESLPSVGEPPKNVTIHWSAGYWNPNSGIYLGDDTYGTSKPASIVACRDDMKNTFYIYSLVPPQRCSNAYCAIEE